MCVCERRRTYRYGVWVSGTYLCDALSTYIRERHPNSTVVGNEGGLPSLFNLPVIVRLNTKNHRVVSDCIP